MTVVRVVVFPKRLRLQPVMTKRREKMKLQPCWLPLPRVRHKAVLSSAILQLLSLNFEMYAGWN